jgi:hypothetical protein
LPNTSTMREQNLWNKERTGEIFSSHGGKELDKGEWKGMQSENILVTVQIAT